MGLLCNLHSTVSSLLAYYKHLYYDIGKKKSHLEMVNSLPINPKAIVVSTLPTITPCKKRVLLLIGSNKTQNLFHKHFNTRNRCLNELQGKLTLKERFIHIGSVHQLQLITLFYLSSRIFYLVIAALLIVIFVLGINVLYIKTNVLKT